MKIIEAYQIYKAIKNNTNCPGRWRSMSGLHYSIDNNGTPITASHRESNYYGNTRQHYCVTVHDIEKFRGFIAQILFNQMKKKFENNQK